MAKQPKLGSGDRFRKLSATLAARGASNPDALAAWIGRRKYGAKKMGRLSHGLSVPGPGGILLAGGPAAYHRDPDENVQCPSCDLYNDSDAKYCDQCGAKLPASAFSTGDGSGSDLDSSGDETLRTSSGGNVSSTGFSPQQITVKGMANQGEGIALAGRDPARRLMISGPQDVMISRGDEPGVAVVRHRRGGGLVGEVRRGEDGLWTAVLGGTGQALPPRNHQRTALIELLGNHNKTASGRPVTEPLQGPPVQTPLMAQYGIPAIRALATPAAGASDGPRTTASGAGDSTDSSGLTPRGQAIYKKLLAKGFPAARAMAFAKNAQKAKPGQFVKAG